VDVHRSGLRVSVTHPPRYGARVSERDIEKNVAKDQFIDTLRRLADALERDEPFRIQVQNRRFEVPRSAALVIEHEVEDDREELSLELQWSSKG
jgi:amphi-Trp domain-containing protein